MIFAFGILKKTHMAMFYELQAQHNAGQSVCEHEKIFEKNFTKFKFKKNLRPQKDPQDNIPGHKNDCG